jgi:peptidoglycan/xylan/chitin deacetylase (PgdA/CDA1 family)
MISALKKMSRQLGLRRHHIAMARMAAERHALASMPRAQRRVCGRILCYHSIGEPRYGVNNVSAAQFRRHIELSLRSGHRFVPAQKIARDGGSSGDLAITFDDGCGSVYETAAPILKSYGVPWSFFVVSEWCERSAGWPSDAIISWRQARELAEQGAELGSHSATHPDFGSLDSSRFKHELLGSRMLIEKQAGLAPKTFAIPFGQSGNWTVEATAAAQEAGYEILYAQAEKTRPAGTAARTFVTAFDNDRIFKALLAGAFDRWEEWY